ncbi:MAG: autotransporter-associated beta strand repeat-containing protein [Opitutaceae bacterium]
MKTPRLLLVLTFLVASVTNSRAQFVWNGQAGDNLITSGGNWVGGVAPSGVSGLDDINFTSASDFAPAFDGAFSVHSITLTSGAGSYNLTGSGQLTLTGDLTTQQGSQYGMLIGVSITLAPGTHRITTGGLFTEQNGADIYLFSQIDGPGDIVKVGLNNVFFDHAGNTFSGSVDLQQGNLYVHGDGALGTGLLMLDGGTLIGVDYYNDSHITVLNNNVSLSDSVSIGAPDGLGSITIAGTTTAQAGVGTVTMQVIGDGILTLGNVAETDPLTTFAFVGDALTRFTGTSTYTGGTHANEGARLIFASAVPAVGTLQTDSDSYIGSEVTTGIQAGFINRFDPANTFGTIGFDSPNINSPQVFSEPIDLTGFDAAVRLGTMTSAVFDGTITPQGSDYLFGGRGILTVNSNLTGTGNVTADNGLLLYLHGNNDYAGVTQAIAGGIIFSSANALPIGGTIYADQKGYIGQTESAGLDVPTYFGHFDTSQTYGVVGFDADFPVNGRTIAEDIDFSTFDSGNAFLGTATNVTFTGVITPSGSEYRFTGFRDGQLTIASTLSGANSVVIGMAGSDIASIAPPGTVFSPSVTLAAANSYSGGTTLQSGKLILGNASALGTGLLTININYVFNQPAGLTTNAPGLNIANPIYFYSTQEFYLGGANDFTLSGSFTDYNSGFNKIDANTVTLSGDNSDFDGRMDVRNGTLIFGADTSAGTGDLVLDDFNGSHGNAIFTSNNPTMGSLSGYSDTTLDLGPGTLTINQTNGGTFSGTIIGGGSLVKAGGATLTLEGDNTYAGNTTITGGTLVAGSNSSLQGLVTLNGGTLSLIPGITLSNPVAFGASGGMLSGSGTFTAPITIGTNAVVSPGDPVGLMTFSGGVTMAPSGTFNVNMESAAAARGVGYGTIDVTGGLVFNATLGNPFTISLHSFDTYGNQGNDVSDFNNTSGYTWLIAHSDSLTGFDPANVVIDTAGFTNNFGIGGFYVNTVGNDLFLNFSPVPEPSTYALLSLGLGAVLFPTLRRRKRA